MKANVTDRVRNKRRLVRTVHKNKNIIVASVSLVS